MNVNMLPNCFAHNTPCNLGPLTTAFVPSATSCGTTHEIADSNGAVTTVYGKRPTERSSCMPSNYNPSEGYIYSPGMCPSRWYVHPDCLPTGVSGNGIITTTFTCCPWEYSCVASREHPFTLACIKVISGIPKTITSTGSGKNQKVHITTMTKSDQTTMAPGILIYSTTTIAADDTGAQNNTTTHKSGGLNTGAKVSIGIGVALGVILSATLLVGGLALCRKSTECGQGAVGGQGNGNLVDRAPGRRPKREGRGTRIPRPSWRLYTVAINDREVG